MTQEERTHAITIITQMIDQLGREYMPLYTDALDVALAALETCTVEPSKSARSEAVSPWVKTADRLPTKEDADDEGKVTALITGMLTGKLLSLSLYYASVTAETADYFLPMPKLPEVEEVD